jgi:hypothetical protein
VFAPALAGANDSNACWAGLNQPSILKIWRI